MRDYKHIVLEPYSGDCGFDIHALVEELGMNVYFDDVDARTCRFCFKADEASPIVDYDVDWDTLERWHKGECGLELTALPHDPARFADDLEWDVPELIGFVWQHGDDDFSIWTVTLDDEDMRKVLEIIDKEKYWTRGYNVRGDGTLTVNS